MTVTGQQTSSTTSHPDPTSLAAFGLGKLEDGESAAIAGHIAACDACRGVVEAVADDTVAGLFRDAGGRGPADGLASPTNGRSGPPAPAGYDVLELVGEGGMGVVFKARHLALGRLVALKQIRPEILAGRDGLARFRREAEAAARLRHPNIVPIYDVGRLDGVPYYAMEYVEGGTLAARLAAGPLDADAAARLVETLARAVEHAHGAGVVHRDLKPGNVLLAPDLECPKIGDFGLAKSGDDDVARTCTGAILGTPNYMAPEQAEGGSRRVGPPADVYALGAIFYEALTARPPFHAASTLETLELVRLADPAPPRRLRAGLPRDLETIALKCLEKAPDRRYASARALAEDLRRYLDRVPILARPSSPPERLVKWARRRPWRAVSAGLGVVAAAGLVAGTLAHNARLRAEITRTEQRAKEAREERERADLQYRLARAAVARMAHRSSEPQFARLTIPAEFQRQLIEDALEFYEGAVRDEALSDSAKRVDKILALDEVATLQTMLGRKTDAERTVRRSLGLADALVAQAPGDLDALSAQVEVLTKLGLFLSADPKSVDESVACLTRAIETADRVVRADPESYRRAETLAWCHHDLGSVLHGVPRVDEAERHYLRAAEIREGLVASHPEDPWLRARLGETLINLGLTHSCPEQAARADTEYNRAADLLAPLVHDQPDVHHLGLSLAKLYLAWGGLAWVQRQPDRAVERYKLGLGEVDVVDRVMPDWADVRDVRRKLHGAMAQAHDQAGRYAAAAEEWSAAMNLADVAEKGLFRFGHAASLARSGEGASALSEVEALASTGTLAPVDLYNLACVASVASAQAPHQGAADHRAAAVAQALAWLSRVRDLGLFRDPEMLKTLDTDTDIDPLRSRREFQVLRLDVSFPPDPFARPH